MTMNERYKIFFNNRYLVDKEIKNFSSDKYDLEKLYDAGISALHKVIFTMEEDCDFNIKDIKLYLLFHIKSGINQFLQESIV